MTDITDKHQQAGRFAATCRHRDACIDDGMTLPDACLCCWVFRDACRSAGTMTDTSLRPRVRWESEPFRALVCAYEAMEGPAAGIAWVLGLRDEEGSWGRTHFDTEPITIELDASCPVEGAIDVLAHELAHAMAERDAGHGKQWQEAKDMLLSAARATGL